MCPKQLCTYFWQRSRAPLLTRCTSENLQTSHLEPACVMSTVVSHGEKFAHMFEVQRSMYLSLIVRLTA